MHKMKCTTMKKVECLKTERNNNTTKNSNLLTFQIAKPDRKANNEPVSVIAMDENTNI